MIYQLLYPIILEDLEDHELGIQRPKTRRDCADVPRPCPYVSCKYNMFFDLDDSGQVHHLPMYKEPDDMAPDASCQLDIAEREGELTPVEVGQYMGMSEAQVNATLTDALRKLRHFSNADELISIQNDFFDLDHIENLSEEK